MQGQGDPRKDWLDMQIAHRNTPHSKPSVGLLLSCKKARETPPHSVLCTPHLHKIMGLKQFFFRVAVPNLPHQKKKRLRSTVPQGRPFCMWVWVWYGTEGRIKEEGERGRGSENLKKVYFISIRQAPLLFTEACLPQHRQRRTTQSKRA